MTRDEIMQMPAGRELDALVAEKVFGWTTITWRPHSEFLDLVGISPELASDLTMEAVPNHSTFILDAWKVVEKMVSIGFRYELRGGWKGDKEHVAMFDIADWADSNPLYKAYADTLALAVSRAALLAVLGSDELEAK